MAVIFGTMHIVKRAGLENPDYSPIIRAIYGVATAMVFGFTYYLKNLIQKKNDTTALEYDDPAAQSSQSSSPRIVTTVCRYDISEVAKLQKSTMFTVAVVVFMHFKFGYIQPLILQSILPLLNMYKNPLFQIHVMGRPAVDALKRPWVPENPFASLAGANNNDSGSTTTTQSTVDTAATTASIESPAADKEADPEKEEDVEETRKDK